MIREILAAAHRLDEGLQTRFGRPYHALLGVGLVIEIVKEAREFGESHAEAGGLVRTALAVLLFAALLIHQLAEMREHFARPTEEQP